MAHKKLWSVDIFDVIVRSILFKIVSSVQCNRVPIKMTEKEVSVPPDLS